MVKGEDVYSSVKSLGIKALSTGLILGISFVPVSAESVDYDEVVEENEARYEVSNAVESEKSLMYFEKFFTDTGRSAVSSLYSTANNVLDDGVNRREDMEGFMERINEGLQVFSENVYGGQGLNSFFNDFKESERVELVSRKSLEYGVEENRMYHVQNVLNSEGYMPGDIDGLYGEMTRNSLYAFQKVNGIDVTGDLDSETLYRLQNPVKPEPKHERDGFHIEVDLDEQLLYGVEDGEVYLVSHVSTGKDGKTPRGGYNIHKIEEDGWRPARDEEWNKVGRIYNPLHVVGNIYIHGSDNVPLQPASLGCIRVMPHQTYDLIERSDIGTEVFIY